MRPDWPTRLELWLVRACSRLWTRREDPADPHFGGRAWAWAPQLGAWRWGFYAGFARWLVERELQPLDRPAQGEGVAVGVDLHVWRWGASEHLYYDGPHCRYGLGPLFLMVEWGWCRKCAGEQ